LGAAFPQTALGGPGASIIEIAGTSPAMTVKDQSEVP
jgi:hypothetical protein